MSKTLPLSLIASLMASTAALAGPVDVPPPPPPVVIEDPAPAGGMYGALSFGAMQPRGAFTQDVTDPDYESGDMEFGHAMGGLAAIGYDTGTGLRVELELGYLHGETGDLTFPDAAAPFDVATTDGTLTLTTGMVNAWYSLGTGGVRPFLGAGLGLMHAAIDACYTLGSMSCPDDGISDSDTAMAYMLGVGAEIPVSDTLSVIGSYRYMAAHGFEMTDTEDTDIEADFDAHLLTVGALFRF